MIAYRSFRNSDPPDLVKIWNSQPPQRWLSQPLTVNRFEQLVLCRPYFSADRLIVATRDDRPIGFVHSAFGPTPDGTRLDESLGVISGLFVMPDERFDEIAPALLSRGEEVLLNAGATRLAAGGLFPIDPFYWGLYGGPLSAGIVASDGGRYELFRQAEYRETRRCVIWEKALACFRPVVDRFQLQIKRKYAVEAIADLPSANWWEACAFGQIDRARYSLRANDCSAIKGSVTFWDMQHLEERLGQRTVGLLESELEPAYFLDGMAVFLLGESMRHLLTLGVTHVTAVTAANDADWSKLLATLGFQEIEKSVVMEKP